MTKKRRVAIVYPWANFDTVPSLCNAVSLLVQQEYQVDIFTHASSDFEYPAFDSASVSLRVLRSETPPSTGVGCSAGLSRFQKLKNPSPVLRNVYRFLRSPFTLGNLGIRYIVMLRRALQIWRLHRQHPFSCFIGVDPEGLREVHLLTKFIRVPFVYYSLELLLSCEISDVYHMKLKAQEIALSHRAEFVIVQDEERAQLLASDNRILLDKCVLVPNAPLGEARRNPSFYWHKKFSLSRDKRIVFHTGSLGEWTGIEEIVESVTSWPESWILVIHVRHDAESLDDILKLRKLSAPGRVFFSLKPVPRQDYMELVDGGDIGIAFYVPIANSTNAQRNIQSIGLSSGKIAYYLQAGLPVIVNKASSIGELLWREGCGMGVEAQNIGEAIEEISRNYERYSENACRFFDNHLDFERSFEEVIRRINQLD